MNMANWSDIDSTSCLLEIESRNAIHSLLVVLDSHAVVKVLIVVTAGEFDSLIDFKIMPFII